MDSEQINLLFCGDRRMVKGVFLCLLTIRQFTPRPVKVYLFSMDAHWGHKYGHAITQKDVDFLSSYFGKGPKPMSFVLVNVTEGFEKKLAHGHNANTSFSPYSLLRLLALDYISEDRLLYLDADIMTCDDLSKLYDLDMGQAEVAAVQDHIGLYWMGKGYFNSGVLLFNLALCRQSGYFERSLRYLTHHHLWMPDQTSLNRSAKEKHLLPECYNDQRRGYREGTIVKHFSQVVKWLPFPHFAKCK
jgi:lipopolysaccharide biosynthesis glycosyltransferase